MEFYSLSKKHKVSFREAVIQGIAPDKTLFFPDHIPVLAADFWDNIAQFTNEEIGFALMHPFVKEDIPDTVLKAIIEKTLSFDFPVVPIAPNIFSLELFHGPTQAFKDVGARFMAECFAYFNTNESKDSTVLVATSGDTGGAVANGFLNVKGVNVVILYPSGKVSAIQEKQLTTLGQNIHALEVEGTFDDCQAMVKKAFLDDSLKSKNLTSANSINVARWLPQMIYFVLAYKALNAKDKDIVFSCPSGNFGNICAGMVAKKMGLPVAQFIAATNSNDTVPRFMHTQVYEPRNTLATISNAMDVSDPSNFVRVQALYQNDFEALQHDFTAYSFTEAETQMAMQELCNTLNYIADPHGAVGYLGIVKYFDIQKEAIGVFLETAHPVKFLETVETIIAQKMEIPSHIQTLLLKEKTATPVCSYEEVKQFLLKL